MVWRKISLWLGTNLPIGTFTLIVHDYFVLVLRIFIAVPCSRLKTYDDKAFFAVAPRLWNQLPPELRGV